MGTNSLLSPAVSVAEFLASRWRTWANDPDHPEIPAARRTLALAGKVALDELLLTAMIASVRLPSRGERRRISREVEDAIALFDSRGWLDAPASYHREAPELTRLSLRRASAGAQAFSHMTFESEYEPEADEPGRVRWLDRRANRTAHAWVLRHSGRPRPWLMCIHGYGMGFPFADLGGFRAETLSRVLGLNLIFPVLPLHGPRRDGRRSGHGFVAGDHLDTVHAVAQAMWDIRRILAWIRRQDDEGVGVYGLSLGGYNAAVLASLDPDLACVIAGVPAICFVDFVREHGPLIRLRDERADELMCENAERLLRVVSPLSLTPVLPRERRFLFGGIADRFIPATHVQRLWEHWGRPRVAWYQGTHVTFTWERDVQDLIEEALCSAALIRAR